LKLVALLAFLALPPLPQPAVFSFHLDTPGECRIYLDGTELQWGATYETDPMLGTVRLRLELRYGENGERRERLTVTVEAGYRHAFRITREVGRGEKG
jgi:hypothetical protein